MIFKCKFFTGCNYPLGLASGDIFDWQISASSWYTADRNCNMKYARLYQPNGRAWCAGKQTVNEWLLIDLGVPAKVNV